jgi:hypothetical protein
MGGRMLRAFSSRISMSAATGFLDARDALGGYRQTCPVIAEYQITGPVSFAFVTRTLWVQLCTL